MSVTVELARKPGATLTLPDDAPVKIGASSSIVGIGWALGAGVATSGTGVAVWVDGVWLPGKIVASGALTLTDGSLNALQAWFTGGVASFLKAGDIVVRSKSELTPVAAVKALASMAKREKSHAKRAELLALRRKARADERSTIEKVAADRYAQQEMRVIERLANILGVPIMVLKRVYDQPAREPK